jgi:hypothetical protein
MPRLFPSKIQKTKDMVAGLAKMLKLHEYDLHIPIIPLSPLKNVRGTGGGEAG